MKVQGYKMSYLPHPMHREAILRTLQLASDDLLFVSHANVTAGLLPYFLARDPGRTVLVLCVRGELGCLQQWAMLLRFEGVFTPWAIITRNGSVGRDWHSQCKVACFVRNGEREVVRWAGD